MLINKQSNLSFYQNQTKKENITLTLQEVIIIKDELVDIKKYQYQFKKTIRARIEQGNGLLWIKQFNKYFNVDSILNKINHSSTSAQIYKLLINPRYFKDKNLYIKVA